MGKKLLAILSLALCMVFAFAACDKESGKTLPTDGTAAVEASNGGFSAETGDYVYFINGKAEYTADNTAGKVEKASLVRVKKADLAADGKVKPATETVASKLIVTGDYSAGISIFGDKIYFATPSNEKDKVGNVQNDDIKFCSVSVNGGKVSEIVTTKGSAGNSAAYRFVKQGDNVYVVFVSTEEVTKDGTTSNVNYINVYGADGTEIAKKEYESYVFDKSASGKYVYYTKTVAKQGSNGTESFNALYRLEIGKADEELLLYGAGSNRNDQDGKSYVGKGVQGVKFTLVAAQNNYVYFSVVNLDTSVSTDTFYAFLGESENVTAGDAEATYATVKANNMTYKGDAKIFAATSIFEKPDCIVYIDADKGICAYNYNNSSNYNEYNGVTVLHYTADVAASTLAYAKDGYLYFHTSGVYSRIAYANGTIAEDAEAQKLSPVAFATTWYAPEIVKVGEKEFILGNLSSADYFDYVFAYELLSKDVLDKKANDAAFGLEAFLGGEGVVADADELDDEKEDLADITYGEFITATERHNVKYNWAYKCLSLLGEDATETVNDHIDTTYPLVDAEDAKEDKGGCSSSAAGIFGGMALLALGGVMLKKRG